MGVTTARGPAADRGRARQRLYAYADDLIADRQANPRDDFVTALTNASRSEDGRLSDTELRDALVLLIFGGFDTTRNQLGLAMQTFTNHLDQWDLLAERPELGKAAVEEVMRVNPTVRWVTREVLEDFEFEGLQHRPPAPRCTCTASLPAPTLVCSRPGFDITAERKPHFGFGGGAHHCLGHFVARSDMSEALPLLARRMRDIRLLSGDSWLPDSGNTGPIRLPIGFTPGSLNRRTTQRSHHEGQRRPGPVPGPRPVRHRRTRGLPHQRRGASSSTTAPPTTPCSTTSRKPRTSVPSRRSSSRTA